MTFDPIAQDAPHNPEYPASMTGFVIENAGSAMNGVVYLAAGEGPYPLIVLLHGFPGHERNFDLAQIFRRAGWHVAVFHYRGSWGSEGHYTFGNVLADVGVAIEYFKQESISSQYRINPDAIITIGHSLGGWAALMAGINGWVKATASLAGVNFGIWANLLRDEPELARASLLGLFEESRAPLHGVQPEALIEEIITNHAAWDLLANAPKLADKRVLLVGAKRDEVVSVFDHHMPQVRAYKAVDNLTLTEHLLDADHAFSYKRIELARTLLAWLETLR